LEGKEEKDFAKTEGASEKNISRIWQGEFWSIHFFGCFELLIRLKTATDSFISSDAFLQNLDHNLTLQSFWTFGASKNMSFWKHELLKTLAHVFRSSCFQMHMFSEALKSQVLIQIQHHSH
jgi:hypothetical protein